MLLLHNKGTFPRPSFHEKLGFFAKCLIVLPNVEIRSDFDKQHRKQAQLR